MFFRKVLSMHCAMLLELKENSLLSTTKKDLGPPEVFKLGKKIEINRMLIKRTIDRFEEISSITDRPRSRCPCSSRTSNLIKSVKEKLRHNLRRSMRKMEKESKISPRTMCKICHDDLKMSPYKLQKRQLISGATIEETGQKQTIVEMTQKWHAAKSYL